MSSNKNIIKSKLTLEKYPYNSLIELLIEKLKNDQDKGCLVRKTLSIDFELDNLFLFLIQIDCSLNRKWTKKQVLDSSLNFGYYLVNECGLQSGDIVCFVTNNSDIHAIGIFWECWPREESIVQWLSTRLKVI